MKASQITNNPYLLFSPFLVIYFVIVLIFKTDGCTGDETLYLSYAENLIQRSLTRPVSYFNLGNGPGYPIILIPFVALRLPLICITLLNAVFYYLSIILLFKVLEHFISFRKTLFFSLFWALYVNSYEFIPSILPETFSVF